MKKDFPLVLMLIVDGNVDRSEFEPDAQWVARLDSLGREVWVVAQRVRQSGAYLIGRTDTFQETFSEVLGDTERFLNLMPAPDDFDN